jgi:hypothetical protein
MQGFFRLAKFEADSDGSGTALSSLLNFRTETKRLKKIDPEYAGLDSVLK